MHHCKKIDITLLGCSAPLSYGVVEKKNKIVSLKRNEFDSVNSISRTIFIGIFSGINNKTEDKISHPKWILKRFLSKNYKKFKSNF